MPDEELAVDIALRLVAAIASPGQASGGASISALYDPRLVDHVREALRDSGLEAERLVVELSERTALDVAHDAGARLAIEIVKLDKSFMDRIATDEGLRLAEAVLELADRLGLEAIAEGVEQASQVAALSGTCCAMAQGYHFSKPVPAADVTKLLTSQPALERHAA